ncbi:MAG: hypothetical protein HY840_11730 [Bacteroidetes bacterium]|nr:hypothetical protein [Bacteroidota bacterium]
MKKKELILLLIFFTVAILAIGFKRSMEPKHKSQIQVPSLKSQIKKMSITAIKLKTDVGSNTACLTFLSKDEITLLVQICSPVGHTLTKKTVRTTVGENNIILPTEDLVPNDYLLKILENEVVYQMAFKKLITKTNKPFLEGMQKKHEEVNQSLEGMKP